MSTTRCYKGMPSGFTLIRFCLITENKTMMKKMFTAIAHGHLGKLGLNAKLN